MLSTHYSILLATSYPFNIHQSVDNMFILSSFLPLHVDSKAAFFLGVACDCVLVVVVVHGRFFVTFSLTAPGLALGVGSKNENGYYLNL
jgi:hypothetical protein